MEAQLQFHSCSLTPYIITQVLEGATTGAVQWVACSPFSAVSAAVSMLSSLGLLAAGGGEASLKLSR